MQFTLLAFAAFLSQVVSLPTSPGCGLKTVHQFPNLTWIENMAVRSNGQILANDIGGSKTFLIDPQNPEEKTPPVAAEFPNGTLITGITELEQDVFYTHAVQGEIYAFEFLPNTSSVWEVDMRGYNKKGGKAAVRRVAEIPLVGVPNGLTVLSKKERTLLIADSGLGLVWSFHVDTGAYEVVFDDPLLKPIPGAIVPFGVNGVHIVENYGESVLYFSNTNQGHISKVPIGCDGQPTGSPITISASVPNADDFAVDGCGNIWLAENTSNTFVRVYPDGHVQTIAGGANATAATSVIGPVAAVFGRGSHDRDTLYISTDGLTEGANGTLITSNGRIAAVDTKRCY